MGLPSFAPHRPLPVRGVLQAPVRLLRPQNWPQGDWEVVEVQPQQPQQPARKRRLEVPAGARQQERARVRPPAQRRAEEQQDEPEAGPVPASSGSLPLPSGSLPLPSGSLPLPSGSLPLRALELSASADLLPTLEWFEALPELLPGVASFDAALELLAGLPDAPAVAPHEEGLAVLEGMVPPEQVRGVQMLPAGKRGGPSSPTLPRCSSAALSCRRAGAGQGMAGWPPDVPCLLLTWL